MPDNLGPNQTRVLDPSNRSFESVVYQKRKPPLSCEWNLTEALSSNHTRDVFSSIMPSGWAVIGSLKDGVSENICKPGDIVTSPSYPANSFRLIATDCGVDKKALIAWVNGYKLIIQGSNSTDENNTIILPDPPAVANRVDFVFLEVWRKLLGPSDVIYRYGNVLYGGTNPPNDLIDPAAGIETSRRIQVQYRIRVAQCNIEDYPHGFDPYRVFAQGPLPNPLSCTLATFQPVDGDPGLWRAGNGDTASQDTLGTVDGYVYAIPIAAVTRRNTGSYNPDVRSNGAGKSLSDYLNGQPSDRPDNLYNDWIVSSDILDMRHLIIPVQDLHSVADVAFSRLIRGEIRGKMGKTTLGEDHYGPVLVQADAVSYVDRPGSTRIASGDGLRRVFSNASIDQPSTIRAFTVNEKYDGTSGTAWYTNDSVRMTTTYYPNNTLITSIDGVWNDGTKLTPNVDYQISTLPAADASVRIGSSLNGRFTPIIVDYTLKFPSGPNGLTELPETFLEARREDSSSSIALTEQGIRVRHTGPVLTNDGTRFNMLYNRGACTSELYNFGHQMVHHIAPVANTSIVTIPRVLNGYQILGVVSVKTAYGYRTFTVSRDASQYTINFGSPPATAGEDVELVLYTGVKFFEVNKQGRAITDTYEMMEVKPIEAANGSRLSFNIDTTNQEIIKIASNMNANGYGIAYVNGVQKTLTTNNINLPTNAKTRTEITFSSSDIPVAGATIEVPILVHSAIKSTEGYTFFYNTIPYQGLLDSTAIGTVEAVGPAIVTTSGSGGLTNYEYSAGLAIFNDSTVVNGVGTKWLTGVRPGYFIRSSSHPEKEFKIVHVYDDVTLMISSRTGFNTIAEAYRIYAKDLSMYPPANIVDRLPTLDSDNDARCKSELISTAVTDAYPTLNTRVISPIQDVVDKNNIVIGVNTADRGRSMVKIPDATYGVGSIGIKFEKLDTSASWQKTYQSYVFNKDNSGRLYLMVVSSESDGTSKSRFFDHMIGNDTVDIFEMPGRPIVVKKQLL